MLRNRRTELLTAFVLVAPFLAVYGWLFLYPTFQMIEMTFLKAPLIGEGKWAGFANYAKMFRDPVMRIAVLNTAYFVLLTVIPGTIVALSIALMVRRLKGFMQSLILAAFFLPYVLPVTVVYVLWDWMTNLQFGMLQGPIALIAGEPTNIWRTTGWFMPGAAILTIWWTNGFSILLFLAGLRNIPAELYEAAELDGATRWQMFTRVTFPLLWPVTVLCLTIQLILQLKIFDQVYLFAQGGQTRATMVMVQYIYEQAFQKNNGGYSATIALALFVIVLAFSLFQFQVLRVRSVK
ncbi:carbohydrate ABC transporter permease [Stagnihabitans tardus]|uniref:ABC transporter permease subunit n=1 Tax=Stagnihabitans tardus TaxID=2699202 RepID=A0AAE4Y5S9_9RHOB|nr:sugar ABC transporter permease [Stagnihabitans tardus]NBZ86281.1 ABC transporter permease subunit [Stagnihabitans tardus]